MKVRTVMWVIQSCVVWFTLLKIESFMVVFLPFVQLVDVVRAGILPCTGYINSDSGSLLVPACGKVNTPLTPPLHHCLVSYFLHHLCCSQVLVPMFQQVLTSFTLFCDISIFQLKLNQSFLALSAMCSCKNWFYLSSLLYFSYSFFFLAQIVLRFQKTGTVSWSNQE